MDITREGRRGRWFHRRTIIPKEGEPNKESKQEHIIFDRSEFRDLEKEFCPKIEQEAHRSKKEEEVGPATLLVCSR